MFRKSMFVFIQASTTTHHPTIYHIVQRKRKMKWWKIPDRRKENLTKTLLKLVNFRFYQVRCSLRISPRISMQIETSVLDGSTKDAASASVIRGAGTSKIFQILYRNEEVILRDTILFRVRLPGKLINTDKLLQSKSLKGFLFEKIV